MGPNIRTGVHYFMSRKHALFVDRTKITNVVLTGRYRINIQLMYRFIMLGKVYGWWLFKRFIIRMVLMLNQYIKHLVVVFSWCIIFKLAYNIVLLLFNQLILRYKADNMLDIFDFNFECKWWIVSACWKWTVVFIVLRCEKWRFQSSGYPVKTST